MISHARLSDDDVQRWLQWYSLEEYLFATVSRRFQAEGTLNARDFFAIVIWKSSRAKTKIRDGLAAAGKPVDILMREVHDAPTPQTKVEALLKIWGIGIAMASAILTVCYTDEFTVLDWRAWETLQSWEVEGLPASWPSKPDKYVQYCRACRRLTDEPGLSLRDLDRVLWGRSWEMGLLELLESGVSRR